MPFPRGIPPRCGSLLALTLLPCVAAEPAVPQFERDVLPIFTQYCWKCHGEGAREAGLDFRTAPLVFQGSDKGPVVIKGSAKQSLIYQKLTSGQMPPGKELKPTPEQIETLRRWIDGGAPTLRTYGPLTKAEAPEITEKDRQFWAFRKPLRPPAPKVRQSRRVRTPVDSFLLAKLEEKGLGFSPDAGARMLMRRAYFDLIGLPPSPEEVDAFAADKSPGAYERLIDRLLASPHFGERWGRHWLDAVGYTDTVDRDQTGDAIELSEGKWRYRDWVISAFNQDKPYDRFLVEQLAGDELVDWRSAQKFTREIRDSLVATSFLRCAPDSTTVIENNKANNRHTVLYHTIEVVSTNLLALTVNCAQCHTHKYDPIPQLDYYRLMAVFAPAFNPQLWLLPKDRVLADVSPAERADIDRHNAGLDAQVKPLKAQLADLHRPYEQELREKKLTNIHEPLRIDTRIAFQTPEKKRTDLQKYLVQKLDPLIKVTPGELAAALSPEDAVKTDDLRHQIRRLEESRRSYGVIDAVYDVGPPLPTYLLRRGNHEDPGPEVQPGFLGVLTDPQRPSSDFAASGKTSGRRLAFARWLTEPDSTAAGLAARVIVNRMWQHLFREGIVATEDNFGANGARPTHPELLDWLATEFVRNGWRFKPLLKLMMTSSGYRQASHGSGASAAGEAADPDNQLLWRMRLRRLESESIRDAMLAASGKLDPTMGGPVVGWGKLQKRHVAVQPTEAERSAGRFRRSVYQVARRGYHPALMSAFDQPIVDTNCTRRVASVVVLQSLAMLNDRFVVEQAEFFAERVARGAPASVDGQIDLAFRIALARVPNPQETTWSSELLSRQNDRYQSAGVAGESARRKALAQLCQMLFNTNEFLYVE